MSSGSGGGNVLESFSGGGNFFENLGSDFLNVALGAGTGGLVGYRDGKIQGGATVEGVKEVTGAKAAEEANKLAREQFEEQKAASELARAEAITKTANDQIKQSNIAGAARNFAKTTSANKGQPVGNLALGQDGKDFLGL